MSYDWRRQPGLKCEFCGGPGQLIIDPEPISVVYQAEPDLTDLAPIKTRITCPEHRLLVQQRALRERDPERFAERHGRPGLGPVGNVEMVKQAWREVLARLSEAALPEVDERLPKLRRMVEDRYGPDAVDRRS